MLRLHRGIAQMMQHSSHHSSVCSLNVVETQNNTTLMLVERVVLQVLLEAEEVFGASEQEPDREAAEGMQYTVACLKVCTSRPLQ